MPYRTILSACGTIAPLMNQATAAETAIRASLSSYVDPYLAQTLGEAKAIGSVELRAGVASVELEFGFPCLDYASELQPALEAHAKLVLDGAFDLHGAKFLKSTIQNQIDQLSRRGQGQPKNDEIDAVISRMQGSFPAHLLSGWPAESTHNKDLHCP